MTMHELFSVAALFTFGVCFVRGEQFPTGVRPAPMSYVIEPFESTELVSFPTDPTSPFPRPDVSLIEASESLFGDGAIQVQDTISFGYKPTYGFQLTSPYNCFGAQSVSLWVKGTTGRVKLILHDDAQCRIDNLMSVNETIDCFVNDNLNSRVMFDVDLEDLFDGAQPDEWREISADFPDFSEFATNRIRGWQLDIVASDVAPILIDQLACHDDSGSLLGNVWHTGVDMATAFAEFTWTQYYHFFQVPLDQISFNDDNSMKIDYEAKKVETWGGFNDWSHIAPANAYYNMSHANGLQFSYSVTQAASIGPNLAEFRLLLNDGADCTENCWDRGNHERYYSFHDILDTVVDEQPELLPFTFSRDFPDPFQLTTFSGQIVNAEFDTQHIKGVSLELSIFGDDAGNADGAIVSGEVELTPLRAVDIYEIIPETEYCTVEENLYFFESASHFYRKIPNQINDCCRLCDEDPDCIFGLTNTIDCFLAGENFDSSQVGIFGTERETLVYRSFFTENAAKRGDWCEKCVCEGDTIDCRGADLIVLPKTYNSATVSVPRLLDLRENPRLFMVGNGMLDEIPDTLQEVWFPGNLKHVSKNSFAKFSNLLSFESSEASTGLRLNNAIIDKSEAFADECCGLGDTITVADRTLTFCNLQYDLPGIDSFLEPFVNYRGASVFRSIRPDSEFLEEAAESPGRCAAYCEIVNDCQYFSYDDRNPNALPSCNLLSDRGSPTIHNTTFDDFADDAMSLPGYVSGYPPRTRVRVDNAAVLSSPKTLQTNPDNDYKAVIEFSLGSTPLRGAVWIELEVTSETDVNVVFDPSFFVLYDDSTVVSVDVIVSKVGNLSSSVLFRNNIVACDEAFMLSPVEPLLIEVLVPPPDQIVVSDDDNSRVIIIASIFAGIALIVFGVLVWYIRYQQKNRHNDAIWKVKQEELKFDDPPEVLGRGTFGLVLLAEYRGTQVAVKRAIPPLRRNPSIKAASQFRPAWFDNFGNARDETEFNDPTNTEFGGTSISSNDPGELVEVPAVIIEDQGGSIIPNEAKKKNVGTVSWGNIDGSASKMMSAKAPVLGSIQEDIPESYKQSVRSKKFKFTMFKSKRDKAMTEEQSWKRMKEDFIEEMRYVSKLRHPCITTVMGAVIDNQEEPMLVMEYMSFGSLYDMLHNETMHFEGDILMSMLRDVAQGIRFLHSSQPIVIHGDLKSANILVDSRLRAKVADFGLSQKGRVSGAVGTPFWMAPELLRGDCVNNAPTDIFAMGIILYEVFSRKDPFEGEDGRTVLRAVADPSVNKRPPTPKSCSVEIRALMEDCWNSDPDKRPSATELDIRLKRIDESKVQTDTVSRTSMRKNSSVSLYDIFPEKIARALSMGHKPEAEHKECVTIFFSDIVNYTEMAASMPPKKVADLLDRLYFKFDSLSNLYDVFKVETIGDAYMAVTNLVKDQSRDHAKRIAQFAIGVVKAANETYIDPDDESKGVVDVRIGFHSGPVVADVVGTKSPRFCLFGDSVNTASRMESHSSKNRINCSKESADLLVEQWPKLKLLSRGEIKVKGKGKMEAFWVNEGTRGGRRKEMMNLNGLDESESTIGDDLLSLGGSSHNNIIVPLVQVASRDAENPGQSEDVGHDEPDPANNNDLPYGDQETEKFENEIEKKMQSRNLVRSTDSE